MTLAKTETEAGLRARRSGSSVSWARTPSSPSSISTETSVDVKKQILQAMFVGGTPDKLIDLARTEKDLTFRRTAIRNLGLMGANRTGDAIKAIYLSDTAPESRSEAINALFLQTTHESWWSSHAPRRIRS